MTNEVKQQFSARVGAANRSQMIVIIYEVMLIYLGEAMDYHAKNQRMEFSKAIKKSRACLEELYVSIQEENELAQNFMQVYEYCGSELTQADIHFTIAPLKDVEEIIDRFREAYVEVAKKDSSSSVMSNAESIYAGLTYSKNDLNENLDLQSTNRGFLV
ncbi:MAG: flagellar protein FliS [Eubacteriales bacterium]